MADKNVVEILITAKDEASKVISNLGKGFDTLGRIGLGIAAAGIGAVTTGIGLAMAEAMQAEGVEAQLNAVLQSTGGIAGVTADAAKNLAEQLQGVTKFSDETILSGENILLTFTNIGKDVFPDATKTMLDMSAALGQDLKGSAIQLGKALQDPILGVTALRRVGVNFTEAQSEVIAKMVETGDLAGAQALILKELQTEFGGSAVAAGETLGGQLEILKNKLLDTAEGFGVKLIPVVMDFFKNVIEPHLPQLMEFAEKLGNLATALFDAGLNSTEAKEALGAIFGPEIAGKIIEIVDWFSKLGDKIGEIVDKYVKPFVTEHSEAFKGALVGIGVVLAAATIITGLGAIGTALGALVSPIGIIILIAGALGAAWSTNFLGIRDVLTEVWNNLYPQFQAIVEWLQVNIPLAIQTVTNFWNNTLMPAIRAVWNFIQTSLMPLFVAIWDVLQVGGTLAITLLTGAWNNVLLPALTSIWNFVKDKLKPIFEALEPIMTTLRNSGINPLKTAFNGVRDAIQWVTDKLQSLADWLGRIKIPKWAERASPSPFEMTFIGADKAIKELVGKELPQLSFRLGGLANNEFFGMGARGGQSIDSSSRSATVIIQSGAIVIQGGDGKDSREIADSLIEKLGMLTREIQIGVA